MLALIVPVLVIASGTWRNRQTWPWLGAGLGLAALLNSWWLVAAATGQGVVERIGGFGGDQLRAFATNDTVLGSVPLSAMLLEGFWADGQLRYLLPSAAGWWWGIAAGLLGTIILFGIYHVIRSRDRLGIALLSLGLIAFGLSLGAGWPVTAPLAEWMSAHIPFYAGYREPHKWLMLLALAYAYAFSQGLVAMWQVRRLRPILPVLLLLPVLISGVMLFGGQGQLRAAQYPAGWAAAEHILQRRPEEASVLVLPWHMYLPVEFGGRTVANPARYYFDGKLLTGNDPELKGVPPESGDPLVDRAADFALRRDKNAWRYLRSHGVSHVLIMKEADWRRYDWVASQPGVKRVLQTDTTVVYEVEASRGR
jgi:hypothetical protein